MIDQPSVGVLGVIALLALLLTGMPIGIALGLVGLVGLVATLGLEPALIKSSVLLFEILTRYELGVLPLFMLMAHLCFASEASRHLFDAFFIAFNIFHADHCGTGLAQHICTFGPFGGMDAFFFIP